MEMIKKMRLIRQNYIIKKNNPEAFISLNFPAIADKISAGKGSYGNLNVLTYGGENCKLIIGNYCSIANDVKFLLGGEHDYNKLSTYPFKSKYFGQPESLAKGDIILEDDVWIGYGSIILSGVKIGQGAIIGAGSVVAKDVPPYAIYVRDKIIKYRFDEKTIEKLLEIDFSKLDEDIIKNNIELLYRIIDDNSIEMIKDKLKQ